jgi:hypothetical protein
MPRVPSDDPKKIRRRARYQENPAPYVLSSAEYRNSNRDQINESRRSRYSGKTEEDREKSLAYHDNDPRISLLNNAKTRAREKNIDCTITREDIIVPEICPYLGIKLVRNHGRFDDDSLSLDRISLDKGYVPGNIEVVSMLANRMKNSATPDQLVMFAKEVLRRYEE